jgi:hypothetical protein
MFVEFVALFQEMGGPDFSCSNAEEGCVTFAPDFARNYTDDGGVVILF